MLSANEKTQAKSQRVKEYFMKLKAGDKKGTPKRRSL
jgi:hypothetical protein